MKRTRVSLKDRHAKYVSEASWFNLSGFVQNMLDLLVIPEEEIPEDERPAVPLIPTPIHNGILLTDGADAAGVTGSAQADGGTVAETDPEQGGERSSGTTASGEGFVCSSDAERLAWLLATSKRTNALTDPHRAAHGSLPGLDTPPTGIIPTLPSRTPTNQYTADPPTPYESDTTDE